LLKSKSPLVPWELASPEPIFGTRKKQYRQELAIAVGYEDLEFKIQKILIKKRGIMPYS